MTATPVTVYYDGQCPLCAREIAHYREKAAGAPVSFVDITTADFDAVQHGLDVGRIRQVLHVRVGAEMHTGIDAAIHMWAALPAYRWLARLARLPGVYALARAGYWVFARFRPYLQRRRRHTCTADACHGGSSLP